jgi:hypothetical protein
VESIKLFFFFFPEWLGQGPERGICLGPRPQDDSVITPEALNKCGVCGIALFAILRTFSQIQQFSAPLPPFRTTYQLAHSFALFL